MKPQNKHREMKLWLFFALALCGIVSIGTTGESFAEHFFVSASNSKDTNPGTQGSPFLTLGKGLSVLAPGDTLFVRGGIYLGSSWLLNIPSGNSWTDPVTIKAYLGEKVVITAEPGQNVLHFKRGSHHIIIDGFVLDGTGGANGIVTNVDSHHIRILNGEIKNAPGQGFITNTGSTYFELINLRIHDNGTSDFDHGMYITTHYNLVQDCEIYRNAGWGIQIYSGGGNEPSFNLVKNNKIYDNARLGDRGPGIGFHNGKGNAAINNLIWGNAKGIEISHASNSKVYNNTVYENGKGISLAPDTTGTQIINNIFYKNTSYDIPTNIGVNTTLSNNLTVNPLFVDEVNRDFHLQPAGPAIKAGVILPEVPKDFDYKIRPTNANYDIGAFQSSNSQAPPTALRVLSH